MAMRQCQQCQNYLPMERFSKTTGEHRRRVCKGCRASAARSRKITNPSSDKRLEQMRDYRMFRKYDLTREQYLQMVKDRNGLCDICGKEETRVRDGQRLSLCVDHVAGTKEVRGLLCSRCNVALGMLDHDENNLVSALEYLLRSKGEKEGDSNRSLR